jgi:hypothetical protein
MITLLMWRVGCCECGISCDVAHGAVRDHLLGYVSPSNHPYRPMSQMRSTSQVTNRDRFIRETGKGVASIRNVRDIDGHLLNLSLDVRGRLGKGWKTWGNPYSRTRVWWLVPSFHVGTVVHLCSVWKSEVLRDRTIRLFLLSTPM